MVSFSSLGRLLRMPTILFSDCCECGQYYFERTLERKHKLEDIRPDIMLNRIAEADYSLHILRSGGHDSVHSIDRLVSLAAFNAKTAKHLLRPIDFQSTVHF